MAGDVLKSDSHTREVFAEKFCSARRTKLSARPSSSRLDPACSYAEIQEVAVVPALNSSARVLARHFQIKG